MEDKPFEFSPTPDQEKATDAIRKWLEDGCKPRHLMLGGYAGTGKTTLIRYIRQEFAELLNEHGRVAVSAFTGKAVNVLRRKGIPNAQTLHSLLFDVDRLVGGALRFYPKFEIDAGFVIVDEASMVSKLLHQTLSRHDVPVLFVGDMGQLEPIGDNPQLMRNPHLKLEIIHRQAAESEIIQYSVAIRHGQMFQPSGKSPPEVWVGPSNAMMEWCHRAQQILCGFNRTRHWVNRLVRYRIGKRRLDTGTIPETEEPIVGDRIICLRNNVNEGVFNGMIAEILELDDVEDFDQSIFARLQEEGTDRKFSVLMDRSQFGRNSVAGYQFSRPRDITFWDFAYAITVHKAQGSSWPGVAVIDEVHPAWDPVKWRYTAVTRAEERLAHGTTQ